MDVSTLSQLIGNLGFPIVCCGILFYMNNKMITLFAEMKDTISKNNELLQNLLDKEEYHADS